MLLYDAKEFDLAWEDVECDAPGLKFDLVICEFTTGGLESGVNILEGVAGNLERDAKEPEFVMMELKLGVLTLDFEPKGLVIAWEFDLVGGECVAIDFKDDVGGLERVK